MIRGRLESGHAPRRAGVVVRKRARKDEKGRRVALASGASALGVLFVMTRAQAQIVAPGGFTWQREAGAEACLSEVDLRGKITSMMGRDPFMGPGAPVARASVVRRPDGFAASVRLQEDGAPRETAREFQVRGEDCTPLTDAVALALTLALSRDAHATDPTPPAGANPAPALDKGAGAPSSNGAVGPWAALIDVPWSLGALPRPVAGLGLELRYALGTRFALGLGGDWLPPATEGGQFSVGLERARIIACVSPFVEQGFSISACGSGEGGAIRIGNEAASVVSAGSHAWFGVGMAARAGAHLGKRWLVEGGVGALVPASRPVYATPTCPLLGFQQPSVILTALVSTGVLF
jgi:hypothetical protein